MVEYNAGSRGGICFGPSLLQGKKLGYTECERVATGAALSFVPVSFPRPHRKGTQQTSQLLCSPINQDQSRSEIQYPSVEELFSVGEMLVTVVENGERLASGPVLVTFLRIVVTQSQSKTAAN